MFITNVEGFEFAIKHVFKSKVESYRWNFDFCTMLTILKPPKHSILLTEASETHYLEKWKFGKTNTISLEIVWMNTPKVQVLYPCFEFTFPLRSCDEHKKCFGRVRFSYKFQLIIQIFVWPDQFEQRWLLDLWSTY